MRENNKNFKYLKALLCKDTERLKVGEQKNINNSKYICEKLHWVNIKIDRIEKNRCVNIED